MAEYIERGTLLRKLSFENGKRIPEVDIDNFPTTVSIRDVKRLIRDIPVVDVAPVVHGRWIEVTQMAGVTVFRCSVCGEEHPMIPSAFCGDCGAKMDGGGKLNE